MRICVLTRAIPQTAPGGLSSASWDVTRALRDAGGQPELITTAPTHSKWGISERLDGILVHWLDGVEAAAEKGLYPALLARFLELHRERPLDLVHSHSKACADLIYKWTRDIPIVLTEHGHGLGVIQSNLNLMLVGGNVEGIRAHVHESLDRIYFRRDPALPDPEYKFFRRMDAVVALSDSSRRDMERGLWLDNVHCIPNCVYPALEPRLDGTVTDRVAIVAANLGNVNKGVTEALRAIAVGVRRSKRAIRVEMIGRLQGKDKLATQLGLDFRAHGLLPRAHVAQILKECDLCVDASSHHTGLNTTLVESLAVGTPTVGFRAGGSAELLSRGGVPVGDVVGLSNCVFEAFADTADTESARRYAYARYELGFRPTKVGAAYMGLFEELKRRQAAGHKLAR